jgi:hypothetical protein
MVVYKFNLCPDPAAALRADVDHRSNMTAQRRALSLATAALLAIGRFGWSSVDPLKSSDFRWGS